MILTESSRISGGGGRWWSECGAAERCFRAHLCLVPGAGAGVGAGAGIGVGVGAGAGAGFAPPAFLRPGTTPRSVNVTVIPSVCGRL